jgi:1-acyl-sn-glycerol-3-phosphate acyltransferase
MRQRGTIPVRRGDRGQSTALRERVAAEVAQGHSILAFPEGTRTRTGRVGPFRRGMFFVARDLGLPVVPVAVVGASTLMRKGDWRLRPADLVVHVMAPIPTAGL